MSPTNTEVRVDRLIAEVTDLTAIVKQLVELTPTRNKIWLRPAEIGQLLGVSSRHIARYREQGRFRQSSYRWKNNRYEYHNVNAISDFESGRVGN